MPSRTYRIFREAIQREQIVTCWYGGFYRELCPHIIGLKDGDEAVLAFQFGGASSSRLQAEGEWRCLKLAGVKGAEVRDGMWRTGSLHARAQSCVGAVDLDVNIHVRRRRI